MYLIMKTVVTVLLVAALPTLAATDIAGTLNYESRMVSSDGITKQSHFRERFVRSADHIWTERIMPANAQAHQHGEDDKHSHSLATAGKLITRDTKGGVALSFVRTTEKIIYLTQPREYSTVGFDGSWEGNWSLVNPAQFKQMQRSKRAAQVGTVWYEGRSKGVFEKVLWDEKNEIALVIETGTSNGSRYSKTTFTPGNFPERAALPWNNLAGYLKRDYEDLLD
ncbi:hypothetical protein ACUHMQ_18530 [Chitinimonas sp. PSY-7]|uniref:hypothetical protein n=1 Tax=Chitinimonas sp. PSY-7 TaxID=3459088 RepID=UPI00403FD213